MGVRQSGEFSFQIGDIYTDAAVLQQAAREAERILAEDPDLAQEENEALRRYMEAAAENAVDFRSI